MPFLTVVPYAPANRWDDSAANSVTYSLNTHTHKKPALVVIKRHLPVPSSDGSDPGVAGYTIKVVLGDVDADGIPRRRNTVLDLSVRMPQDNDSNLVVDGESVLKEILAQDATGALIPVLRNGLLPNSTQL